MIKANNFPKPNSKQLAAIQKKLDNNPSMVMIPGYGFYSDGTCIISIYWSFDKNKEEFPVQFDLNGYLT